MWKNESANNHCMTSSCASHCRVTGRTIQSYWSKDGITAHILKCSEDEEIKQTLR